MWEEERGEGHGLDCGGGGGYSSRRCGLTEGELVPRRREAFHLNLRGSRSCEQTVVALASKIKTTTIDFVWGR